MEPILIEKEQLKELTFKEVKDYQQDPDLQRKLIEATRLGNGYQTKVGIIFYDDSGLKRVNTTIWATGSQFISLKGGMWLPINHIIDIVI